MVKIIFFIFFIAFSVILFGQDSKSDSLKAVEIHKKVLTLDSHADTPLRFLNGKFDIGKRNSAKSSKIDLPRMKEGEMDAVFFAVFLGQGERTKEANKKAKEKALEIFNGIHNTIEQNSDLAEIATTPEDALDYLSALP